MDIFEELFKAGNMEKMTPIIYRFYGGLFFESDFCVDVLLKIVWW